jgi:hypothetical protein
VSQAAQIRLNPSYATSSRKQACGKGQVNLCGQQTFDTGKLGRWAVPSGGITAKVVLEFSRTLLSN